MSPARLRRPPPPRGAAALAVLAALAAAAGCARQGAAPEAGPATTPQAARATEAQGAPSAATTPSAPGPGASVPATDAAAPAPGASALAAVLAAGAAAPSAPELTLEQMQRRSPSAALVETFNAACAEPARSAVRRAARRLEFTPVAAGAPTREEAGDGAEAWRGPEEVGDAVLVWDEATSTCELRTQGVDLLLVEAAFSRLQQALEEEGASVMRLQPPPNPAGGVRTRQMLLVQPGGFSRPERARVLRLGHHLGARGAEGAAGGDTVTLSARAVSAPR